MAVVMLHVIVYLFSSRRTLKLPCRGSLMTLQTIDRIGAQPESYFVTNDANEQHEHHSQRISNIATTPQCQSQHLHCYAMQGSVRPTFPRLPCLDLNHNVFRLDQVGVTKSRLIRYFTKQSSLFLSPYCKSTLKDIEYYRWLSMYKGHTHVIRRRKIVINMSTTVSIESCPCALTLVSIASIATQVQIGYR